MDNLYFFLFKYKIITITFDLGIQRESLPRHLANNQNSVISCDICGKKKILPWSQNGGHEHCIVIIFIILDGSSE